MDVEKQADAPVKDHDVTFSFLSSSNECMRRCEGLRRQDPRRAEAKEQYIVKTLLQRARAGDADAFADLFQSHADGLWRTAMAVLREEQSAADALQETAIKAWRSIPSFQGTSSLGTWLTRILLNTCFDAQRGEGRIIARTGAITSG